MTEEDFQRRASTAGRTFEDAVEALLVFHEWTIDERHAKAGGGVEIDYVATDSAGVQWWIECKGSTRGKVPGSRRGDTVKKAVGVAWFLSTLPDRRPYMLITSHLPADDSVPGRLLNAAKSAGLFDRVLVLGFGEPAEDLPEDES